MRMTVLGLLLVVAGLTTACNEPTCDDLDELQAQLDDTSPSDNEYYELSEKVNRARADCNAR